MTSPADVIHDATSESDIDDLVSQIRIAIRSWHRKDIPHPTESQALAFVGMKRRLTAVLTAFEVEIGQ